RVVQALEVVEIHEQDAEDAAVPARLLDHLREAVREQAAVRQAGERVELREVGEALLAREALQARAQDRGDRIEEVELLCGEASFARHRAQRAADLRVAGRSEEHTSELQS